MSKVRPALLKGFDQEYLPQEQLQFNRLVEIIRRNFELFGFVPIETPAAERKEVLTSKGGVEKEIYALTRLAADGDDDEASIKGALHFDLTVPLARYVAMRERELAFPFRRYQIQKVWRGETPQARKGRFREFYQCDIDIINRDKLSYLAEAEIPSVIHSVFREMGIGEFRIRINNRKVLKGVLQRFNVADDDSGVVLRSLDKIERETSSVVLEELSRAGLSDAQASQLLSFMSTKRDTNETLSALSEPAFQNEMCKTGTAELRELVSAIRKFGVPESAFCIDLAVVRGLDYYTGTIYETTLNSYPELGSICSGGRYDDLASYFTDTKLPGVGISIGLTRLFSKLKEAGLLRQAEKSACVCRQKGVSSCAHRRAERDRAKRRTDQGSFYADSIGISACQGCLCRKGRFGRLRETRAICAGIEGQLMALDLEEQEQVAELKAWWTQHGNLVLAVVIAAAVAVVGWQGWRWYQHGQAAQASVLYDTLTKAAQAGDAKTLRDAAGTLVESYPRTLYASMGALLAAKFYFAQHDLKNAKVQLQWVIEHSASEDFRDLARLRLAAVLLDEKAYDEALKLLDVPHAPAYDAQYAALKGDVLVAKNQLAEARAAYRLALEKADQRDSPFRESVRMRLDALGG